MNTFPTHVTHAQMKAVCDVLGLPANQISTLTLDASKGLTATAYVLTDGQKFVVGPDGEPAVTTVRAPVGPDGPAVEFDSSPAMLQRLRDALHGRSGQQ